MGIRVHKAAGYGIHLYKLNVNSLEEKLERASRLSAKEFAAWLTANRQAALDLSLSLVPEERKERRAKIQDMYLGVEIISVEQDFPEEFCLSKSFVHNPMLDNPNTLVLIPPTCVRAWTDYDRMTDYLEECQKIHQIDSLLWLTNGIYPHDKGEVPATIAALLLWIERPDLWGNLREVVYTYWA